LDKNRIIEPATLEENMSIVSAPGPAATEQAFILKSMVIDLGWFNGD